MTRDTDLPPTVSSTVSSIPQYHCGNCGTALQGAWCHACGQGVTTRRVTLPGLLRELPRVLFDIDRGVFNTLRGLLRQPGQVVNDYLDGRRVRWFNPLTLLVLWAGVSTFLFGAFPFDFSVTAGAVDAALQERYVEFQQHGFRYYSASLVLYLPFQALVTWACFAGHGRNLGEHLALNAFLLAAASALTVLTFPAVLLADRSGALVAAWGVVAVVLLVYQTVALYATFTRPGARLGPALRSVLAMSLTVLLTTALQQAFFHLVYARL